MQENKTRRITVTFRQTIGTLIPEKPFQAPYTYIILPFRQGNRCHCEARCE